MERLVFGLNTASVLVTAGTLCKACTYRGSRLPRHRALSSAPSAAWGCARHHGDQGVLSSSFGQKVFYLKERGDPQGESSSQPCLKRARCLCNPGTPEQVCWPRWKPEQVSEARRWCKSTYQTLSTACWDGPNPARARPGKPEGDLELCTESIQFLPVPLLPPPLPCSNK